MPGELEREYVSLFDRFAAMIRAAGFEMVKVRNLSMGIAALHSGWKI